MELTPMTPLAWGMVAFMAIALSAVVGFAIGRYIGALEEWKRMKENDQWQSIETII